MRTGHLGAAVLGKTAEPVVHVGCVAYFAGFSVADDIDADLDLALHDIEDGLPHLAVESGAIEARAILSRPEQGHDRIGPRQAADMGR